MVHSLAKEMGPVANMQLHIVVLCLDPIDIRGAHQEDSAGLTDREPFEEWSFQPLLPNSCLRPFERPIKSLVVKGFEQIIDCRRIEGTNGMLVVCGDENHAWWKPILHPLEDFKSTESWQLH